MKESTSSGIAEPYVRYKLKARTGEEKGRHLWPRLVQKLESRSVPKQKQKNNAWVGTERDKEKTLGHRVNHFIYNS